MKYLSQFEDTMNSLYWFSLFLKQIKTIDEEQIEIKGNIDKAAIIIFQKCESLYFGLKEVCENKNIY